MDAATESAAQRATARPAASNRPSHRLIGVQASLETRFAQADNRQQLLKSLAAGLIENSSARLVMLLSGTDEPDQQPVFDVLASKLESVSGNIEKWATTIGTKAGLTSSPAIDTATDSAHGLVSMIGLPLPEHGKRMSLAAMFIDSSDDQLLELMQTQTVVDAIRRWEAMQSQQAAMILAADTAAIADIESQLGCCGSIESCCTEMADQLKRRIATLESLDLESSTLTVYVAETPDWGTPEIKAISGCDTVEPSELVDAVESAMAESMCRSGSSCWPPAESDRHALLCHQRLAQCSDQTNLLTTPVADGEGDSQLVITITSAGTLSAETKRFCESLAQSCGNTIRLVRRAEQNRLQRWVSKAADSFRGGKLSLLLKAAAMLVAVGLIPMPYRIGADCEIQPATRRFVSSPFEGQLKQCLVEPGDLVTRGELLANLDDREIRLEQAEIAAEIHRAAKQRDGHVAQHETGEARLAGLEADRLQARSELLALRSANLELRSPIEGIIIAGDHKKAVGMRLETGHSLFEIAPLDELLVEVFLPEDDVRYAAVGQSVAIRLESFPFEVFRGVVQRIHPAAEIKGDSNVFVARIELDQPAEKLRPGMQGSAKVSSVWRPIAWNWLHKPVSRCLRWLGW